MTLTRDVFEWDVVNGSRAISFWLNSMLRRKYVDWGSEWNYLKMRKVDSLFSIFTKVEYKSVGFLGAFGRSENQRRILGRIDRMTDLFIPENQRYILIGIAER